MEGLQEIAINHRPLAHASAELVWKGFGNRSGSGYDLGQGLDGPCVPAR
jgi:hypothetical protein